MTDDMQSEKEALGRLGEVGVTAEDLAAAAGGPRVEIPARVDSAIRAAARGRAREIREGRGKILRLPVWLGTVAAAAVVFVALGLWSVGTREAASSGQRRRPDRAARETAEAAPDAAAESPAPRAPEPAPAAAMDIDESGVVDIVDAFLMSRRLRKGGKASADWDFDRDGEIGKADVEAVAMAAVSLEGGWR